MAYNYCQVSAGFFQYINDNFLHAPSDDLSRDSLKALTAIMLAQAQEIFVEKVVTEKKSSGMIAKLAAQASLLYSNAAEALSNESIAHFYKVPLASSKVIILFILAQSQIFQCTCKLSSW